MFIFDFDKTLTDKDTLFGFYRAASISGKFMFPLKHAVLLFFAVLYKGRFISNTTLKKAGVFLFLKGLTKVQIDEAGKNYSKTITLNKIYEDHFKPINPNQRIVISASLQEYLIYVFPKETVYGSKLSYRNDKVTGLQINMYGAQKLEPINANGYTQIDAVYTDSYSDSPLIDVATHAYLVQNSSINKIK